jgi:hypothetical protein
MNNIKYAWYSEKQFKILKSQESYKDNNRQCKPYIYYINTDNEVIQITEITNENKVNPNFDDVIFKGIVKSFYKTSSISI